MKLKEIAQKLKTDIPAIFLALNDKDTPVIAKVIATVTIVYALSPIDLIPDFIPVLGLLDDLIILPLLITLCLQFIPEEQIERFRIESQEIWKDGKPKKWYYTIPVILFWITIIILIIKISS